MRRLRFNPEYNRYRWLLIPAALILLALLLALCAPAHGHSIYGSASARNRSGYTDWELTLGSVYDAAPVRVQMQAQHERDQGTRYTDLDGRAVHKGERFGAGVRWANIEEHDMYVAEWFAELRRGPFGFGVQQAYRRWFDEPRWAGRLAVDYSCTWSIFRPAVHMAASYGGVWTTEASAEIGGMMWRDVSIVPVASWERRDGRTRAQAKATLRMEL